MRDLELNLMRLLSEYQEDNKEVGLITIIFAEGINNCEIGAMMLINNQGEVLAGGLKNELIQKKVAGQGKICMDRRISGKTQINSEDGSIEIFVNVFCNQDSLIIAGAGTASLNIYKFARMLGYRITIADNKENMLTTERFPEANKLLLGDIVENLSSCTITENTYIVIATDHHEFDEQSLQAVISSPARYIGILRNSRSVAGYFKNLEQLGISADLIKRVHSPIGLDLGGKGMAEIALAVMAEIQAVKYHRTGGSISKREL